MKRTSILVGLLVLLMVATGGVLAQEGTSTPTATPEDNQSTNETETSTPTPNGGENVQNGSVTIPIGEYVQLTDSDKGDVKQVRKDLGSYGHIYKFEANPENDTAWLYIKADRDMRITLADAQGIDLSESSGSYFLKSYHLLKSDEPYKILVQATRDDKNQGVTITGDGTPDDRGIWISTGNAGGSGILPDSVEKHHLYVAALAGALAVTEYLFTWVRRIKKKLRRNVLTVTDKVKP
ncbi:hypothetical protein OB920_13140 [Halobacteria archaeon HArc-gm2]|nr:hypothetical protein [Halobacteria archaeon HArc-gm2]